MNLPRKVLRKLVQAYTKYAGKAINFSLNTVSSSVEALSGYCKNKTEIMKNAQELCEEGIGRSPFPFPTSTARFLFAYPQTPDDTTKREKNNKKF